MKPVSSLFFLLCLFVSCKNNTDAHQNRPSLQGLIPYAQRYPGDGLRDTLLPGNAYLKYRVRADTADGMLYICYGRPGFDSVYKQKDGAPYSCGSFEYAYHTSHTIGLMYECAGDRALLVLPLGSADSVHVYTPLFVSVEDSLLLVEDAGRSDRAALLATDLDFRQRKPFRLSYPVPCSDILACFDTIYFNRKLVMEYETGENGQEPVPQVQAEALGWKP